MKKRKTLGTQSSRFEKMCEEIHDNGIRSRVSDIMGEKMPNYQSENWQKRKVGRRKSEADRGPCPRKRDGKDQEKKNSTDRIRRANLSVIRDSIRDILRKCEGWMRDTKKTCLLARAMLAGGGILGMWRIESIIVRQIAS
jgi:hypothetical protein